MNNTLTRVGGSTDDAVHHLPGDLDMTPVVRSVLGSAGAEVTDWWMRPVPYDVPAPTTGGLYRCAGVADDGGRRRDWTVFVKVVQAWRHWPLFEIVPPELRARGAKEWRHEVDLYASGLDRLLPDGLRLPTVHRIQELGDDRVALWLEDVRTVEARWDLARFGRAAHALGRLAARLSRIDILPASAPPPGTSLTRRYYESRVLVAALPALRSDALWVHPLMSAADTGLRQDVMELGRRIPDLMVAFERLPQLRMHGDACPQNLLIPADDPESFVVIDWGMCSADASGAELAQLLIGLAHAGVLSPDELPELRDTVVAGYTAGLAVEGKRVAEDDVRFGCDVALLVRAAFTALPVERLVEPATDALADLVRSRLELTRYLVDLGLGLTPPPKSPLARP